MLQGPGATARPARRQSARAIRCVLRKWTNGRRSRCASGQGPETETRTPSNFLDVHDVKQRDASRHHASRIMRHAGARAPVTARGSDVEDLVVEGLVSCCGPCGPSCHCGGGDGPPPVSLDFSSVLVRTGWFSWCWPDSWPSVSNATSNATLAGTSSRANHAVDRAIVRWRRRVRRNMSVQST
jgi:hypothetical protein